MWHAAGPWKQIGAVIADVSGEPVCVVGEPEKNAAVIQMAPEMLAVLKRVKYAMEVGGGWHDIGSDVARITDQADGIRGRN